MGFVKDAHVIPTNISHNQRNAIFNFGREQQMNVVGHQDISVQGALMTSARGIEKAEV